MPREQGVKNRGAFYPKIRYCLNYIQNKGETMGWLDEAEYEFHFRCPDEHISSWKARTCDREPRECLVCGKPAEYLRFTAEPMLLRGKVAFEHNGRLGFRITDGKGGVRHTAAAKERYLETGDIKPAYTPAFRDHLIKTGQADKLIPYSRQEIIDEREKVRKAKVSKIQGRDPKGQPPKKEEKAS